MEGTGCGGRGFGSLCGPLAVCLSLSLFLRLPYLWSPALDLSRRRWGCGCVSVVRARLRETQRLPARMRRGVGLGTGRGLRLRRGLGPGPRPEVPEACQGSPRQRAPPPPPPSPVLWFPGSRRRRGSRAARRQPRSAAGVGAPATHPGRGWKAGDRSERGGVRGASGRWGLRGWGAGAKGEGRQKKKKEKEKKRKEKPTAPGIPRRSPIQVLTRPDPA